MQYIRAETALETADVSIRNIGPGGTIALLDAFKMKSSFIEDAGIALESILRPWPGCRSVS